MIILNIFKNAVILVGKGKVNFIYIILILHLNYLFDFLGYYFILLFLLFYRKFLILRMGKQKESKSNYFETSIMLNGIFQWVSCQSAFKKQSRNNLGVLYSATIYFYADAQETGVVTLLQTRMQKLNFQRKKHV